MQRSAKLVAATIAFFVSLSGAAPAVSQEAMAGGRRVLVAALYPYIPNPGSAYLAIEERFERVYPDIDLQIELLGDNYYNEDDPGSISKAVADVYEVDSVFLADFIKAGKIAPLGESFRTAEASLVPLARTAANRDGKLWGLPHWLCGNFLYYRTGDAQMQGVRTLGDLEQAIGTVGQPRWLIADFAGTSTLGEMYLDAAMDATGSAPQALDKVMKPAIDPDLFATMERAIRLVRPYFGRDQDYHDLTGFYARQFARGSGRALVGYSEQMFFALSETKLSCRRDEDCLRAEDIQVSQWPLARRGSSPIAWVDILAIDARAAGQRRADAETFLQFMTSEETYKLLLMPEWPYPPRYLLPARESLYADPDLAKAAPLYRQFRAQIDNATPITAEGLNARLRTAGKVLNSSLSPR